VPVPIKRGINAGERVTVHQVWTATIICTVDVVRPPVSLVESVAF
jgi:hypothetical protein